MYTACMFDLDGTLANTLDSIAWFGNTALERCGLKPLPVNDYRLMVGNGADLLIERMIRKSAGKMNLFAKVRSAYDALYESNPLYLVAEYDGITSLLLKLKDKGIKTAVLSNKPDDMTRLVVKGLFGDGLFDAVRGQLTGYPKKPDPAVPLMLLDAMGATPGQCLYIGDSGVDMETGRNAGMDTAGAAWGFRGEEELRAGGAKYIVHTAEDLEKILFLKDGFINE